MVFASCSVSSFLTDQNSFDLFRQLIYNYPEQLFADAGVMAIEHADFEGVERLALVLGMFLQSIKLYSPNHEILRAFSICRNWPAVVAVLNVK